MPAGAPGQCRMDKASNVNGKGLALANGTVPSIDDCCSACQALEGCNEYVYCDQYQGRPRALRCTQPIVRMWKWPSLWGPLQLQATAAWIEAGVQAGMQTCPGHHLTK
jgi:hypothetical protein